MHAKSKKNVNFLTIETHPYKKSTIVNRIKPNPVYFFADSKVLTSANRLIRPYLTEGACRKRPKKRCPKRLRYYYTQDPPAGNPLLETPMQDCPFAFLPIYCRYTRALDGTGCIKRVTLSSLIAGISPWVRLSCSSLDRNGYVAHGCMSRLLLSAYGKVTSDRRISNSETAQLFLCK